MAGLADLFGGGGMFGGGDAGGMFGDLLTPEMKQQMAFRGLMAAAGAFGQAAMPSRMPVPIGAALGSAAAAMAGAQDQGLENALKMALTSGKVQELKSQIAARTAGMKDLGELEKAMTGGLAAPATPSGAPQPLVPSQVAPGADALVPRVQSGDSLGGGMTAGGALAGKISDPRGLVPYIQETAAKYGIDPDIAVRVAQSEGLANPIGDGGKSGGAFQLYTGGGIGNEFQKDTGKSPLDLANEKETIDYALRKASQVGWGPWHGAKKVGIAEWQGIGRGSPDSVVASAPDQQAPLVQVAQNGPLTSLPSAPAAAPSSGPPVPQAPSLAPGTPDAARLQAMLQALALKNAYMGLSGDKQPYNSLIGVLQGSPQYKAAIEAATRGAGLPFVQPEAYAKEQGTRSAGIPYDVLIQNLKADLDRRNALAQQGGQFGPDGVVAPVPGFAETIAGTKGAQAAAEEKAKAEQDIVTVPRVDPATGLMTNIRMSRAALAQQLAAQQQAPNPAAVPPAVPSPVAPGAPAVVPQVTPPQGAALVPGSAMLPIGAEPAGIGQVPAGQQMVMTPSGPTFKDVPGSATARATEQRDLAQKQSTDIVSQDIDRALQLSRNVGGTLPAVGPVGTALKAVPGTAAHDLQEIVVGLRANTGFAELNKMRQQSPTGGALGPVSDTENKLLQSTLGSLEQSQTQAQFELNLKRLHNVYMDVVHGTPEKLDAEVKAGKITATQRQQMLDKRYEIPPPVPAGVPVTKEQYDKLPPGTMFIAPDGSRRIKPGAQ